MIELCKTCLYCDYCDHAESERKECLRCDGYMYEKMEFNKSDVKVLIDDYSKLIDQAKLMNCKDIAVLYHIPIENVELIVLALKSLLINNVQKKERVYKQGETESIDALLEEIKKRPLVNYFQLLEIMKIADEIKGIKND